MRRPELGRRSNPERNSASPLVDESTDRERAARRHPPAGLNLGTLVESSLDAIAIVGGDGTIRYESPSVEQILGYKPEELMGKSVLDFLHPDDVQNVAATFETIGADPGQSVSMEVRFLHKDGSWRAVEGVGNNLLDEPGVNGFVVTYRDVTERKRAEEALQESAERFRALIENSSDVVSILNADGTIRYESPAIERILGYGPEERLGHNPIGYTHPDDREGVGEAFARMLENPDIVARAEARSRHKDGSWRVVEFIGSNMLDTPAVGGIVINFRDITHRRQMEEALRESEEKLKRYLEGSPDVIVVTDLKGTILYINDAGERLIGYTREEFIGNNFLNLGLLAPGHKSKPKEWLEAGGAEKAYSPDEFELIKKDGTRIFTEVSTLTICPEGDPAKTEIIAIVRDISERKRMEQTLRESEEEYSMVVANVADAVFKYRDGSMTWANDQIEEMLGYTKEELIANDVNLFVSDDVSLTEVTREVDAGIKKRGHFHGMIRAKKKDGSSAIVEYTASMVPGKEPPEIVGIARDITERRRAEEERERLTAELAEKNREQEQVIYVTSHDLRSPLVNVQGFSKELKYSLQEMTAVLQGSDVPPNVREQLGSILESDIGASLQFIETSISKMDTLLSGLLRLSRMGRAALDFRQLNMNELLSDIQKAFEYRIQEAGVSLQVGELPPCQGDEVQINQVFSNLVDNALKYLDPERPGMIEITGEGKDGRAVICVQDNGMGIAPEHQQKIFEIFHRLNPGDTTGEGLGLSIIKKILSRHNGEIWVESEAGAGSKFLVSLPAAE
jgi:PAS domain S-box-containing protein